LKIERHSSSNFNERAAHNRTNTDTRSFVIDYSARSIPHSFIKKRGVRHGGVLLDVPLSHLKELESVTHVLLQTCSKNCNKSHAIRQVHFKLARHGVLLARVRRSLTTRAPLVAIQRLVRSIT
jgi:hypothetical protein